MMLKRLHSLPTPLSLLSCYITLTLLISTKTTFVTDASSIPLSAPFHPQKIKTYISNRCQNPFTSSSAIWSWEGRLVDPTNGEVIANVEGIELVRTLSEIERPTAPSPSSSSSSTTAASDNEERRNSLWRVARGLRRLHDLKVKNMLTAKADQDWDYAGTVLCRKLFCYSPPSGTNKGLLLKEYKHNHHSPIRNVGVDEAVALYDTATTFISRCGGMEMEVVTEWPDGRWVQSGASAGLSMGDDDTGNDSNNFTTLGKKPKKFPFGFTAYVKRNGKGQIPSLPKKRQTKSYNNYGDGGDSSSQGNVIPRSKFIQLGKDEDSEHRRFGARETYSYIMGGGGKMTRSKRYKRDIEKRMSNMGERVGLWDFDFDSSSTSARRVGRGGDNSCIVQYTRYGEAPPWYAPGKMVTLELLGRRVDSVQDAPPLAATLAATQVPGFMSVHTPIEFKDSTNRKKGRKKTTGLDQGMLKEQLIEDTAAINAVKWFRGNERSLPLQILSDGESQQEDNVTRYINRGLNALNRIRDATTLSAAVEN